MPEEEPAPLPEWHGCENCNLKCPACRVSWKHVHHEVAERAEIWRAARAMLGNENWGEEYGVAVPVDVLNLARWLESGKEAFEGGV